MASFFVAMFSHDLMATCVHKHVKTNTAIAANHIPWAHLWSNHRDKGVFTADIRIVNREHWYVYELQHTETRSTIDALGMRQQPVVVVVAFFHHHHHRHISKLCTSRVHLLTHFSTGFLNCWMFISRNENEWNLFVFSLFCLSFRIWFSHTHSFAPL